MYSRAIVQVERVWMVQNRSLTALATWHLVMPCSSTTVGRSRRSPSAHACRIVSPPSYSSACTDLGMHRTTAKECLSLISAMRPECEARFQTNAGMIVQQECACSPQLHSTVVRYQTNDNNAQKCNHRT
jgi:hypothetical protein